jgi:TonB family protein
MIAIFLALVAAATQATAGTAVTVDIGDENVELAGAGTLKFDGDAGKLAALGADTTSGTELHSALTFDHDGRLLECTPAKEQAGALGIELCRQLRERARFELMKGLDLPFRTGRLAVGTFVMPAERPVLPIRFLPRGQGKPAFLMTTGPDGSACENHDPLIPLDARKAICAAWLAAGKPEQDGRIATVWLAMTKSADPEYATFSSERISVKYANVRYLTPPPQVTYLMQADGRLILPISAEDYSARAQRDMIEGQVRVLVGVNHEGKFATCRPIQSSGTPFLDYHTCRIALQKGRFQFTSPTQQFQALRYIQFSLTWKLP